MTLDPSAGGTLTPAWSIRVKQTDGTYKTYTVVQKKQPVVPSIVVVQHFVDTLVYLNPDQDMFGTGRVRMGPPKINILVGAAMRVDENGVYSYDIDVSPSPINNAYGNVLLYL